MRKRSFLLLVLAFALLIYLKGASWLRAVLLNLSSNAAARRVFSDIPLARRLAERFVAGERNEDALAVTRLLNARGLSVTLDYLGENVMQAEDAAAARDEISCLLDRIRESGVDANVSVKLTQLGLKLDPGLAAENARCILERARNHENKIRIDMEESAVTDDTLRIYRWLRDEQGFGHRVGIVIQAYLFRSEGDIRQLIEEGAWIRLCKGAYAESPHISFAAKAETDANFVRLSRQLLSAESRAKGVYAGFATHDEAMIAAVQQIMQERAVGRDEFEFQMLFGVRRDLQESLAAQGHHVRVYVPYGDAWYPYLVRRLAEHPANLWFFAKNLLRA